MIWFVEFPSGLLLVVLLVLYGIVSSGHFLLFVGAVGGTAVAGCLFVHWCWDRQDKRRARKLARMENQLVSKEQK